MRAHSASGTHAALANNEVSLLREQRQAAKLRILVDGKERLPELICDGIQISTPGRSTAYNLSAHGPIVAAGCELLPLTHLPLPATPLARRPAALQRARRPSRCWNPTSGPVSATADYTECATSAASRCGRIGASR